MATISYTIPNAKLADFKTGFLNRRPVPLDSTGTPLYTENEWIKEWGKQGFFNAYTEGKRRIARKANPPVIDGEIIA